MHQILQPRDIFFRVILILVTTSFVALSGGISVGNPTLVDLLTLGDACYVAVLVLAESGCTTVVPR